MSQSSRTTDESSFTGGVVVVKLGHAGMKTTVHRKLLQTRWPYFERIPTRRSGEALTIALNDVDPDVFCHFLSWLYTNTLDILENDVWMCLWRMWLLAERFQIPALQNQVVELFSCRLHKRTLDGLGLEILHFEYDNTGPGSTLRMLVVHVCVYYGLQDMFEQMWGDMPTVFHDDYAQQQADRARRLGTERGIQTWDLTEFLIPEVEGVEVKIEVDKDVKARSRTRCDTSVEDRTSKRKKAKRE